MVLLYIVELYDVFILLIVFPSAGSALWDKGHFNCLIEDCLQYRVCVCVLYHPS